VPVTLEQRVKALERSVREIAEVAADTARDRKAIQRLTAVAGRHPDTDADDTPIDP
jgi:hypothetical protein